MAERMVIQLSCHPRIATDSKMRITIVASKLRFYQFSEINHRRALTQDHEDVSS